LGLASKDTEPEKAEAYAKFGRALASATGNRGLELLESTLSAELSAREMLWLGTYYLVYWTKPVQLLSDAVCGGNVKQALRIVRQELRRPSWASRPISRSAR
jgi:hypothetical protein